MVVAPARRVSAKRAHSLVDVSRGWGSFFSVPNRAPTAPLIRRKSGDFFTLSAGLRRDHPICGVRTRWTVVIPPSSHGRVQVELPGSAFAAGVSAPSGWRAVFGVEQGPFDHEEEATSPATRGAAWRSTARSGGWGWT